MSQLSLISRLKRPFISAHSGFFGASRPYSSTQVTRKTTYITHLKQWHMPGEPVDSPMLEKIARSQYGVAMGILRNPDSVVVQEDLYFDLTPNDLHKNDYQNIARRIFPAGLPDHFKMMTEIQKKFLANIQGAATLFYLGKLSHIHKSATPAEANRINAGIAIGRLDLIFNIRETLAIQWGVKAAQERNNPQVLLIFGAGHHFDTRVRTFNNPNIIYKNAIATTRKRDDADFKSGKKTVISQNHSLVIPDEALEMHPDDLWADFIAVPVKFWVTNDITNLTELQAVYAKSPWVIEALLGKKHLRQAFNAKRISLEILSELNENQINLIPDNCTGRELPEKITAILSDTGRQDRYAGMMRI